MMRRQFLLASITFVLGCGHDDDGDGGQGAAGTASSGHSSSHGAAGGSGATSGGSGGIAVGGSGGEATGGSGGSIGGAGGESAGGAGGVSTGGAGGAAGSGGNSGGGGTGGTAPVCVPLSTEACYSGPSGTAGVGMCKQGARTCDSAGSAWAPCLGEVVPTAEACGTPEDEDCDGSAPACGANAWAKIFGDANFQEGYAVAVDSGGNVIVTGPMDGTVDFGGGPLTAAGVGQVLDVFVVKLDAAGQHLWSKRFGDGEFQAPRDVTADGSGNVIVVGECKGTIDFGTGPLVCNSTAQDGFIAKFDAAGNALWSKRFGDDGLGGNGFQIPTSVVTDASGNVFVAGYVDGEIDLGSGDVFGGFGGTFVVKLDASGTVVGSVIFVSMGSWPNDVAVDGSGGILLTGTLNDDIDFGGGALSAPDTWPIGTVAKLDSNFGHVWSKAFGEAASIVDVYGDIAANGDVFVTGSINGTADLGCGSLGGSGGNSILFTARFTAAGDCSWSKPVAGSGRAIAVGNGGEIAVAGGTGLAKLAGITGAVMWSKAYVGNANSFGVAMDTTGAVIIAGPSSGNVDFGNGSVPGLGGVDIFVAKFQP